MHEQAKWEFMLFINHDLDWGWNVPLSTMACLRNYVKWAFKIALLCIMMMHMMMSLMSTYTTNCFTFLDSCFEVVPHYYN